MQLLTDFSFLSLFSMFEYEFMKKAFLVGIMLAVIIPCIGIIVVLKRFSMIGDALSHSSLAGVAAGLVLGINPILGAITTSIAAALAIEVIRKRFPRNTEISIAIIMSAGIGLAGILSGFVNNAANFNSFLFGSIVSINDFELYFVGILSALVFILFIVLFKELFFITLDERAARLAGVPVRIINFIFTILTAVTVSVASRTVGALVVSSLMVIPCACSMQISKSYKQTVLFSILFAVAFTMIGLFISYHAGLKPGATIVLTGIAVLVSIFILKPLIIFIKSQKHRNHLSDEN